MAIHIIHRRLVGWRHCRVLVALSCHLALGVPADAFAAAPGSPTGTHAPSDASDPGHLAVTVDLRDEVLGPGPGGRAAGNAWLQGRDLGIGPLAIVAVGGSARAFAQPGTRVGENDDILIELEDSIGVCIRGENAKCRERMGAILSRSRAQGLTVASWLGFERIRNNMYFYLMAPSLRLAVAIVQSRGGCGQWRDLATSAGVSLSDLVADASQEVGGRTTLPEFKEVRDLERRVRNSCTSGDDD